MIALAKIRKIDIKKLEWLLEGFTVTLQIIQLQYMTCVCQCSIQAWEPTDPFHYILGHHALDNLKFVFWV